MLGDESFVRVACNACGMSFHRRVLTDEWLLKLYAEWISSDQVDAFEAALREKRPDAIFKDSVRLLKHLLRLRHMSRVRERRVLRLLDFGCGDGKFLGLGTALGFASFGIDFSTSRRARAERFGVLIASSLDELRRLTGDGFDCVTLFEVLEHVSEPRDLLDALRSLMLPEGLLLIETPNCSGISVPRSFDDFHKVQPLEHVNHFTPKTLKAICEHAGFVAVPRVPAHITTQPLSLLKTEVSRFLRVPTTSQYFRRL